MTNRFKGMLIRLFGRKRLGERLRWIRMSTGLPCNPYLAETSWPHQRQHIEPLVRGAEIVVDIGSGNNPAPCANILVDAFPDDNYHRSGNLETPIPLIVCSVERTPFADKSVDFAICSHVLEHVVRPSLAASELARIAKAGYIETPSYGTDLLVGSGYMHRWLVVSFEQVLYFYEYSARQKEASVTSPVMRLWLRPWHHP